MMPLMLLDEIGPQAHIRATHKDLEARVALLSEEHRALITYYAAGYTHKEIQAAMGYGYINAVGLRLQKICALLKIDNPSEAVLALRDLEILRLKVLVLDIIEQVRLGNDHAFLEGYALPRLTTPLT